MAYELSQDGDQIRERIIKNWIGEWDIVDRQIDGLQAIGAAFWSVLATMTGALATRAVLNRALSLASREQSRVKAIQVVDGGLDLSRFRSDYRDLSPDVSRVVLASVVNALVLVLHRLMGSVLVPLLREIEEDLNRTRGATVRPALEDEEET